MIDLIRLMEVALNTLWLLIAIGAFLFWRTLGCGRAPARRTAGSSYRVVALASALILLFPSISLTDDLHQEQAVMEDSSRSVMKARELGETHQRAGRSLFPAVLAALPYFAPVPYVFTPGVVSLRTPVLCLNLISPCEGRSPPA